MKLVRLITVDNSPTGWDKIYVHCYKNESIMILRSSDSKTLTVYGFEPDE